MNTFTLSLSSMSVRASAFVLVLYLFVILNALICFYQFHSVRCAMKGKAASCEVSVSNQNVVRHRLASDKMVSLAAFGALQHWRRCGVAS